MQYLYHVPVFSYLDSAEPIVDTGTGLRAYRISIVSDDGLPDVIEFVPPRTQNDHSWGPHFGDKPVRVKIDLSLMSDLFECDEEELNDGFVRYTFLLSDTALELPGAVVVSPEPPDIDFGERTDDRS